VSRVVAFSTRVAALLLMYKKGSLILAIEKMVLPCHLFTGLDGIKHTTYYASIKIQSLKDPSWWHYPFKNDLYPFKGCTSTRSQS